MIKETSILIELNKEVDVAVVTALAHRGGTEDPDALRTVPSRNLEDGLFLRLQKPSQVHGYASPPIPSMPR